MSIIGRIFHYVIVIIGIVYGISNNSDDFSVVIL